MVDHGGPGQLLDIMKMRVMKPAAHGSVVPSLDSAEQKMQKRWRVAGCRWDIMDHHRRNCENTKHKLQGLFLCAPTSPIEMVMLLVQLVSQCCRHLVGKEVTPQSGCKQEWALDVHIWFATCSHQAGSQLLAMLRL